MAKRVLVVEDNELNLKLFCDLLKAHGYETVPTRDGREVLELVRAERPDLIVMDIQLPHVSGLDVIRSLKSEDELKTIPVLEVTAFAGKGDDDRIRDEGAAAYGSTPISVTRFLRSEERRLGNEYVRTGKYRGWPVII